MPQNAPGAKIGPAFPGPHLMGQSSVTIVENGQMNNYFVPNIPVNAPRPVTVIPPFTAGVLPPTPVQNAPPPLVQSAPPVRVTQPFLRNMHSAKTISNMKVEAKPSAPVKSYSLDMSTNATPFGPKLSLKKPNQR